MSVIERYPGLRSLFNLISNEDFVITVLNIRYDFRTKSSSKVRHISEAMLEVVFIKQPFIIDLN